MRRWSLWVIAAVVFTIVWLLWPVRGWLAEERPQLRSPMGWMALPPSAPVYDRVRDDRYAGAAARAVTAMRKHRIEIESPSLSAAVAIDGAVVWTAAVGWADLSRRVRATPETVYRIGSTSKSVTATGLARMVDAGLLSVDTPLREIRARWPNPAWAALTPRQLASHTAGLPGYEENSDWMGLYQSLVLSTPYATADQALSVFDGARLLFEPGRGFHYSSFDTVLLSAAMAKVAGKPFMTLMKDMVFKPLRLYGTGADADPAFAGRVAVHYQRWPARTSARADGATDRFKPWRPVDLSLKRAGGGLVSTPADLVRLGAAWLDETFIKPETREAFWTPVPLADGRVNEQAYALGWRRRTVTLPNGGEAVDHLNHGGVSKGAQCWLMIVPEHGLALALAMNTRTPSFFDFAMVYRDILAAFLSAEKPADGDKDEAAVEEA
ncbi:MAG: serine hydrolase domain-containing protein [Alphaproteobacteria bacterium]